MSESGGNKKIVITFPELPEHLRYHLEGVKPCPKVGEILRRIRAEREAAEREAEETA